MNKHTLISILPDINECRDKTDNCNHTCTNTIGSFVCGCNSGFHLDDDLTTCIGMYLVTSIYTVSYISEILKFQFHG